MCDPTPMRTAKLAAITAALVLGLAASAFAWAPATPGQPACIPNGSGGFTIGTAPESPPPGSHTPENGTCEGPVGQPAPSEEGHGTPPGHHGCNCKTETTPAPPPTATTPVPPPTTPAPVPAPAPAPAPAAPPAPAPAPAPTPAVTPPAGTTEQGVPSGPIEDVPTSGTQGEDETGQEVPAGEEETPAPTSRAKPTAVTAAAPTASSNGQLPFTGPETIIGPAGALLLLAGGLGRKMTKRRRNNPEDVVALIP